MDEIKIRKRRSLREVLPKKGESSSTPVTTEGERIYSPAVAKRSLMPRFLLWFLLLALLIFLFIVLSTWLTRLTFIITPRQATVEMSEYELIAYEVNLADDDSLSFSLITNEIIEREPVTASSRQSVTEKASGQIIVYNEFEANPQKLIARTRFESPDGKIYRIAEPITIPGYTQDDDQIVPGSVEATVYAEEAGEEYNIGLVDFTIPGFENTARYDKVYAKSKTSMVGGFVGEKPVVSEVDKTQAEDILDNRLTPFLDEDLPMAVPSNFVLFPDFTFKYFESPVIRESENGSLTMEKKLVQVGAMFNLDELAKVLAREFVADSYRNEEIEILNPEDLEVSLIGRDRLNPEQLDELTVILSGSINLAWKVDQDRLANELRSLHQQEMADILTNWPAIERARTKFLPPWIRTAPKNPDKIKIKLELN